MYPPDQHNVHPFLPVFLDSLEESKSKISNDLRENGSSGEIGFENKPQSESKFLAQLLFGHIFNKEVNYCISLICRLYVIRVYIVHVCTCGSFYLECMTLVIFRILYYFLSF
jgi:hypothetical protein